MRAYELGCQTREQMVGLTSQQKPICDRNDRYFYRYRIPLFLLYTQDYYRTFPKSRTATVPFAKSPLQHRSEDPFSTNL